MTTPALLPLKLQALLLISVTVIPKTLIMITEKFSVNLSLFIYLLLKSRVSQGALQKPRIWPPNKHQWQEKLPFNWKNPWVEPAGDCCFHGWLDEEGGGGGEKGEKAERGEEETLKSQMSIKPERWRPIRAPVTSLMKPAASVAVHHRAWAACPRDPPLLWCNHILNYQERVLLHHGARTRAHHWGRESKISSALLFIINVNQH